MSDLIFNAQDQIKKFIEIRKNVDQGSYLNPFKAREHIIFLLELCDQLIEALGKINDLIGKAKEEEKQ